MISVESILSAANIPSDQFAIFTKSGDIGISDYLKETKSILSDETTEIDPEKSIDQFDRERFSIPLCQLCQRISLLVKSNVDHTRILSSIITLDSIKVFLDIFYQTLVKGICLEVYEICNHSFKQGIYSLSQFLLKFDSACREVHTISDDYFNEVFPEESLSDFVNFCWFLQVYAISINLMSILSIHGGLLNKYLRMGKPYLSLKISPISLSNLTNVDSFFSSCVSMKLLRELRLEGDIFDSRHQGEVIELINRAGSWKSIFIELYSEIWMLSVVPIIGFCCEEKLADGKIVESYFKKMVHYILTHSSSLLIKNNVATKYLVPYLNPLSSGKKLQSFSINYNGLRHFSVWHLRGSDAVSAIGTEGTRSLYEVTTEESLEKKNDYYSINNLLSKFIIPFLNFTRYLVVLDLSCSNIGDDEVFILCGQKRKLTILDPIALGGTWDAYDWPMWIRNLQELILSSNRISDIGFSHVMSILSIPNNKIRLINLSNNLITGYPLDGENEDTNLIDLTKFGICHKVSPLSILGMVLKYLNENVSCEVLISNNPLHLTEALFEIILDSTIELNGVKLCVE